MTGLKELGSSYEESSNSIIVDHKKYIGHGSLTKPIFPLFPTDIPEYILTRAINIGIEVHYEIQTTAITTDFNNELDKELKIKESYPERYAKQVLWGNKVLSKIMNKKKRCLIEAIVYDKEWQIGGLVDIIVKDNFNNTILIDIKTRNHRKNKKEELQAFWKDALQILAYRRMWNKMRNDNAIAVIMYTKQEIVKKVTEKDIPEKLWKLYDEAKKLHLKKLELWGADYWKT